MLLDTYEKYDNGPCVVVLGKFDGVHIGHKTLFETAKNRFAGKQIVAFTFATQKISLTSSEEKEKLLYDVGADVIIEQRIDNGFFDFTPAKFLEEVIHNKLNACAIVCGKDFLFGKNRSGDVAFLMENADKYAYELVVLEDIKYKDFIVKSTLIRNELKLGHIENVNSMLGYTYNISGIVEKGKRLGRQYGFPTANIFPPEVKLLPPNGVYATKVLISGEIYYGITNVGIRPSVNGERLNIETHILGFSGDIYDESICIYFMKYFRKEMTFASVDELFEQISTDKKEIEEYFEIDA